MNLEQLEKNWDELAKTDPLWSILTFPNKKGNSWELDEFFKTGIEEINTVMEYIESLGINLERKRALDFGCGVGRLTQSLCNYFDEVYGIDISPTMIKLAEKYKRSNCNCHYIVNKKDDLKEFSDNYFNFIYTSFTLQHMYPKYSKRYIKEFLRILHPKGLLIFQLPSHIKITGIKPFILYISPKILLHIYHKLKYKNQPTMEMYGIKQKHIVNFVSTNGGKVIDIVENKSAGHIWVSFRYCVTKE